MAQLQKLIQQNGSESSELMRMYLTEAKHSFMEHSKKSQKMASTSSSQSPSPSLMTTQGMHNLNTNMPPQHLMGAANINNNNINLSNQQLMTSSSPIDMNLNMQPPSTNMNLTGGVTTGDMLNCLGGGGSPSPSLQSPCPFPDLSMAELSPLPGGLNLNMAGFDNMCLPNTPGDSLNGNNNAYSPGPAISDNLSSSPGMPNFLDPYSPSEFFTGNMATTSSPSELGTSPRNSNLNFINISPSSQSQSSANTNTNAYANTNTNTNNNNNNNNNINSPTGGAAPSSLVDNNGNAPMGGSTSNVNMNTQQQQPNFSNILSPGSIKTEPLDTPSSYSANPTTDYIKQEPSTSDSTDPSSLEFFAGQNRLADVDRVLADAQMTPEESRLLLLNQVTDLIVEAHMGTTFNLHANVAEAKERIAGCKMDPDMIPDMSRLSLSASDLWQQFLTALVPEITKVVKYSKKLPAFSEFLLSDQIKLIKQGAFEVMVARYSILVDEVNELMLDPKLEMMSPRHVIRELPMVGQFLDEFFTIAKQFNPLCLSDGEIALFTAILMICPDREGLDNQEAISRIQDLILQALYLLMKQNTTRTEKTETTFKSLIGMIGQFRKVNDDHRRFLNNIKMRSPSEFDSSFPALHQELFDNMLDSQPEASQQKA